MNAPRDFANMLGDLDQLREDIAFARALRTLKVVTAAGEIPLQFSADGENAIIDLRSISPSGKTVPSQLPAQTGQAGKLLSTDGAVPQWV